MASRKLQALDAIKRYFAQWGHSPTLGEVAAALGVSNKRAHDLVHQLATERMIEHKRGKARGIRLIDRAAELSEADILLMLAARGWTVSDGRTVFQPVLEGAYPVSETPLTDMGLPLLPRLDHDPTPDNVGTA